MNREFNTITINAALKLVLTLLKCLSKQIEIFQALVTYHLLLSKGLNIELNEID